MPKIGPAFFIHNKSCKMADTLGNRRADASTFHYHKVNMKYSQHWSRKRMQNIPMTISQIISLSTVVISTCLVPITVICQQRSCKFTYIFTYIWLMSPWLLPRLLWHQHDQAPLAAMSGHVMAFSEQRDIIISACDQRSIMNWLYWHNQWVGYRNWP